jgi:hypothetical protein
MLRKSPSQRGHPVAALQTECLLWSREPEDEIVPVVRALIDLAVEELKLM